jgi:hypothetical protein
MRKIISRESEEKKRKRNQLIIGGILIVVMALSTIGYSLNSGNKTNDGTSSLIYNKLQFTKTSGFWNVQSSNLALAFTYNPNEVNKTNSDLNLIGSYSNKPLYIYSENSNAATEVYRNFVYLNKIVLRMQDACPVNQTCKEDVPTKNCTDNFIIIKASNETTSIKQNQNCVFIYGKAENLVKQTDSFLYKITGIQ